MNEEQFSDLGEELVEKLSDGPGSHVGSLEQLAQQYTGMTELAQILEDVNETLQSIRIVMQYLMFDAEASRRERDRLAMILADRDSD